MFLPRRRYGEMDVGCFCGVYIHVMKERCKHTSYQYRMCIYSCPFSNQALTVSLLSGSVNKSNDWMENWEKYLKARQSNYSRTKSYYVLFTKSTWLSSNSEVSSISSLISSSKSFNAFFRLTASSKSSFFLSRSEILFSTSVYASSNLAVSSFFRNLENFIFFVSPSPFRATGLGFEYRYSSWSKAALFLSFLKRRQAIVSLTACYNVW